MFFYFFFFFFSSRRRHTRFDCDWSSDVCSSDLGGSGRPYASMYLSRRRGWVAKYGAVIPMSFQLDTTAIGFRTVTTTFGVKRPTIHSSEKHEFTDFTITCFGRGRVRPVALMRLVMNGSRTDDGSRLI